MLVCMKTAVVITQHATWFTSTSTSTSTHLHICNIYPSEQITTVHSIIRDTGKCQSNSSNVVEFISRRYNPAPRIVRSWHKTCWDGRMVVRGMVAGWMLGVGCWVSKKPLTKRTRPALVGCWRGKKKESANIKLLI